MRHTRTGAPLATVTLLTRTLLLGALLVPAPLAADAAGASAGVATAPAPPDPAHVDAAVRLMTDLQVESAGHAAAIRAAYAPVAAALALANRTTLQQAIASGSILTLPRDVAARNLRPRLIGRHPIGEADLEHQHLYVGARPETVGLLLEIAARVRSGPLEVTSLARHEEYQRRLARINVNARTAVPTHVMGLAADISILHTSLVHAREIRDVLRTMARDGDLFFIAERRQLVFHVVPAPARRAHYAAFSSRPGQQAVPLEPVESMRAAVETTPAARAAITTAIAGSRSDSSGSALIARVIGAARRVASSADISIAVAATLAWNAVLAAWSMMLGGALEAWQ